MINIFLENNKLTKLISGIVLGWILLGVFVLGLQAMENEKRITFDGSLYNWFGTKLSKNIFDYSPMEFWERGLFLPTNCTTLSKNGLLRRMTPISAAARFERSRVLSGASSTVMPSFLPSDLG